METTIKLLNDDKKIPDFILSPVIDFSKNFTDICHHSKEENSLFPALEKAGMPRNMGPIAMMLMDHERSREIAKNMEESAKEYFESGNSTNLVNHMKQYVEHITEHLWKENNRLFMMAEARLQYVSQKVDKELNDIEDTKLKEIGKTREEYESLVEKLAEDVSKQEN
jgi:hemerythrin-like domain-containing protein